MNNAAKPQVDHELLSAIKGTIGLIEGRLNRLRQIKALLTQDGMALGDFNSQTVGDDTIRDGGSKFAVRMIGKFGKEIAYMEYCLDCLTDSQKQVEAGLLHGDGDADLPAFGSGIFQ